jgi:hypothetical protein
VDDVRANVLPADKRAVIVDLQRRRRTGSRRLAASTDRYADQPGPGERGDDKLGIGDDQRTTAAESAAVMDKGGSRGDGKTYYFCAVSGKRKFDENPQKYSSQ